MYWITSNFGIAGIVSAGCRDFLRAKPVVSPARAFAVAVISGVVWPVFLVGFAQILVLLAAGRVLTARPRNRTP